MYSLRSCLRSSLRLRVFFELESLKLVHAQFKFDSWEMKIGFNFETQKYVGQEKKQYGKTIGKNQIKIHLELNFFKE